LATTTRFATARQEGQKFTPSTIDVSILLYSTQAQAKDIAMPAKQVDGAAKRSLPKKHNPLLAPDKTPERKAYRSIILVARITHIFTIQTPSSSRREG